MDIQKLSGILMRVTAVLLILVLFSSGMVTGRYARYSTTVSGSDIARVAKFSVTESSTLFSRTLPVNIQPGGIAQWEITVENASEVAIQYTIQADNPYKNLPLDFQVRFKDATYDIPFQADMAPSETATFILVATWTGDNSLSHSGKVDLLDITVNATQID